MEATTQNPESGVTQPEIQNLDEPEDSAATTTTTTTTTASMSPVGWAKIDGNKNGTGNEQEPGVEPGDVDDDAVAVTSTTTPRFST